MDTDDERQEFDKKVLSDALERQSEHYSRLARFMLETLWRIEARLERLEKRKEEA